MGRLNNKNKLLLSIMGLLLLGLLTSAFVAYFEVKARLLDSVRKTQQLNAMAASTRLSHWSEENIRAVTTLARYLSKSNQPLHNNPVIAELFEQVRLSQHQLYLGYALEQDGYYYVNDWQRPPGYDPRSRPWYQTSKTQMKPMLSWPFVGAGESVSYIAFTAPVVRNDEFIGVVSGDYALDFVENTVLNIKLDMQGIALLTDKKGDMLIEPQQTLSGKAREEVHNIVFQALGEGLEHQQPQMLEGDEYFYSVSSIVHSDWLLLLAVPKSHLQSTLYRQALSLLAHFVMVFVAVMLLFSLSNRRIFSPLIDFLELDETTGLPNKRKFKQLAQQRYLQRGRQGLLLVISMDNFNRLSAAYHPRQMTMLLKQMKKRVQAQLNQRALLGQFSECRLIAYVPRLPEQNENWHPWLQQLLDALQQSFMLDDVAIECSFSIGACGFPHHGQTIEALINNAFAALTIEKQRGQTGYGMYAEQLKQQLGNEVLFVNAMKEALKNGEFSMVYQAQYHSPDNRLSGMEALLRWHSKALQRTVPPDEFIAIAESSGLIVPLGDYVIESVVEKISQWQNAGLNVPVVSINVSPKQLLYDDFIEKLMATLNRFDVPANQIELEITETSVLQDPQQSIAILRRLRSLGFKLAMDDFGTGYSSLQYLKVMPVDKLKIDRAFIRDLGQSDKDLAIVKMIVSMAQTLGCQVLAEGAETAEQVDILKQHQCYLVQGYYYAKPVPAEDLVGLMCLD